MYQYHSARGTLIDLEQYEHIFRSGASFELPDRVWPRYMLYLCDWGDCDVSCLDCVAGRVFLVHMGQKFRRSIFEVQASSLQAWWEQWLVEQPCEEQQKRWAAEQPRDKLGERQSPSSLFLNDDFDPFDDDDEPLSW